MGRLRIGSRFGLVGPGAIGLYYGGVLARAGAVLKVAARSDFEVMKAEGIRIRMIDPRTDELKAGYLVKPNAVVRDTGEIGVVDCVIVAAKATVNESLVESLRPMIKGGHTVLLTLQNGMGNAEFFARHFPETPILVGLCFVCVNRTAPAVVENYLPGRVELGSLNDQFREAGEAVVEVFNEAGIQARYSTSCERSLWRKLCWNIPFNGLSIAGGGITTDKILGDPELAERARVLMEEVRGIAGLAGQEIPESFLEGQIEATLKMGAYQPSSLIDFLEGRAVEVEAIWGEPIRRGEALGAVMPELKKLKVEISRAVAAREGAFAPD